MNYSLTVYRKLKPMLKFFKNPYSQSKGKMNVCKINNSGVKISWTTMKI